MQNIAETTPARNPDSVNDRRSHQCARPGWRPRQRTPRQLARDIAESIRARLAEGRTYTADEYGLTADNAELLELVARRLGIVR